MPSWIAYTASLSIRKQRRLVGWHLTALNNLGRVMSAISISLFRERCFKFRSSDA